MRFPFSDLSATKLRPAVVLADAGRGDWILCQVTSRPYSDSRAIEITDAGFAAGGLRVTSYARPCKLFTASPGLSSVSGRVVEAGRAPSKNVAPVSRPAVLAASTPAAHSCAGLEAHATAGLEAGATVRGILVFHPLRWTAGPCHTPSKNHRRRT